MDMNLSQVQETVMGREASHAAVHEDTVRHDLVAEQQPPPIREEQLNLGGVPKHELPSHLPPHNISLGHPHASAPSMLYLIGD